MHKKTAGVLAATIVLTGFTACNNAVNTQVTEDPFASSFEFTSVASESSETVVTTTTAETEAFKGYRMINVYLNGDLVSVQDYDADGNMTRDKYLGDDGKTFFFEYDENGNMTKDSTVNLDGAVESMKVYEYDASGNLIKTTFYNGDGSVGSSYECVYDESGFLVMKTVYSAGDLQETLFFENDAYGNCTKQAQRDADGQIYEIKYEYEYDAYGNITKMTTYRGGELHGWEENTYDEKGNLTCEKEFSPDGDVRTWIEYEFNEDGKMTVQTIYSFDGQIFQIIMYGYDSNGLAISTKFNSEGEIVEMYQYVYTY